MTLRAMRPEDAGAVAAIYTEGILGRAATFETEPRTAVHVAPWAEDPAPPVVVAERGGSVVGFARVTPYSARPAYAGVGECGIYVAATARGQGLGAALLEALAEEAEWRGYWKLLGKLFPENEASLALMEGGGFRRVGLHRRHGRLDGRWRDVVLVERLIGPAREA